MTSSAEATQVAVPFPAPAERPRRRGGRHLKAVSTRRRRSTAIPVLVGAGVVMACLFAVAVMHALLIGGQFELDEMRREVASEAEAVERLRLQVAELEAPDRVLLVARERLGMQEPGEIGYVLPEGAEDATGELIRVTPATVPPPPTTAPPAVASPEQADVDAAVAAALASAGQAPADDPAADDSAAEDPPEDDGAAATTSSPPTSSPTSEAAQPGADG